MIEGVTKGDATDTRLFLEKIIQSSLVSTADIKHLREVQKFLHNRVFMNPNIPWDGEKTDA